MNQHESTTNQPPGTPLPDERVDATALEMARDGSAIPIHQQPVTTTIESGALWGSPHPLYLPSYDRFTDDHSFAWKIAGSPGWRLRRSGCVNSWLIWRPQAVFQYLWVSVMNNEQFVEENSQQLV